MFKDIARSLDVGALPQIALVAFVVAFLCVLAYALWLPRAARRAYAAIPLESDSNDDAAAASASDDATDRGRRGDGIPHPHVLSTPR